MKRIFFIVIFLTTLISCESDSDEQIRTTDSELIEELVTHRENELEEIKENMLLEATEYTTSGFDQVASERYVSKAYMESNIVFRNGVVARIESNTPINGIEMETIRLGNIIVEEFRDSLNAEDGTKVVMYYHQPYIRVLFDSDAPNATLADRFAIDPNGEIFREINSSNH